MPQTKGMRVLILDNYDSFTYNLYDYVASFGVSVDVKRNDEISIEEIGAYSHIILSPGPGLPIDAGIMPDVIAGYSFSKPILGVCLGMQGITEFFGGKLYNLDKVRHGRQLNCFKRGKSVLLEQLPQQFPVGLYHSWAVTDIPDELKITCLSEENVVMAIEHSELPVFGVQFHPESVLTPDGKDILRTFLSL